MSCHHTLEAYMHAYLEGIGLAAEPKLDLILQRTAALGMHGKVTISHGFCLGDLAERERDALLARMAELRVAIVTTAPAAVPVPSVAACRAAGVTVIGGNDGVRDTWTPFGSPDMLERAMLIAMRDDFRRDDALEVALDCVTHGGARLRLRRLRPGGRQARRRRARRCGDVRGSHSRAAAAAARRVVGKDRRPRRRAALSATPPHALSAARARASSPALSSVH